EDDAAGEPVEGVEAEHVLDGEVRVLGVEQVGEEGQCAQQEQPADDAVQGARPVRPAGLVCHGDSRTSLRGAMTASAPANRATHATAVRTSGSTSVQCASRWAPGSAGGRKNALTGIGMR